MMTVSSGVTISLNNAEATISLLSSSITAIAVLIGGFWAYFKFVRGRTFSPRADIEASGIWCITDGTHLLKFKVTMKNVGSSKFTFTSKGTFFQVSGLAQRQGKSVAGPVSWRPIGARHRLFGEVIRQGPDESWLEPGEWTTDEFLIDPRTPEPLTIRYDIYVECKNWRGNEDIHQCGIVLSNECI